MGSNKTKLLNINSQRREKFELAYELIGEKIYRIPIKFIVENLEKENWSQTDILYLLIYLQQYMDIMQENIYRKTELNHWINTYQDSIYAN